MERSGAFQEGFLPLHNRARTGLKQKRAGYAATAACSLALFAELGLPRLGAAGGFVAPERWLLNDPSRLLLAGTERHWTAHSGRNFLPPWAQSLGVSRCVVDSLGWKRAES